MKRFGIILLAMAALGVANPAAGAGKKTIRCLRDLNTQRTTTNAHLDDVHRRQWVRSIKPAAGRPAATVAVTTTQPYWRQTVVRRRGTLPK